MDSLAIRQKGRSRRSRKSYRANHPLTQRPSLLIFFRELNFAIPEGAPRWLSRTLRNRRAYPLLWMPPKAFADLMRELILDPAGMKDSTFEQLLPPEKAARTAKGHRWNGVPIQGGGHVYPEISAAGLWTTASDLAHLGSEVMRVFRGEPALGLKQETVMEMLHPNCQTRRLAKISPGLAGLAAVRMKNSRLAMVGGLKVSTLFPALGKGAAVMVNSFQGGPLLDEIINAIGREFGFPASQRGPWPKPFRQALTIQVTIQIRMGSPSRSRKAQKGLP